MEDSGTPLWTTIIFAAVAVYGATLSTWEFVSRREENKPRLKVEPSSGFLPHESGIGPTMLFVQVSNVGNRIVHVQTPALLLPDGKQIVFLQPQSHVQFPHRLEAGTNCMIWTPVGELARQLIGEGYTGNVSIRTFCKDQVGNKYEGGSIEVDTNDWASRE